MHNLSDYDYDLPEECIAQVPAGKRDQSRLLVLNRSSGKIYHKIFYDILSFLRGGDVLVLNDTRVIPARVMASRGTGGAVEIFLVENEEADRWKAMAKPSSRLKEGERLTLRAGGEAVLEAHHGSGMWSVTLEGITGEGGISKIGRMPLPHYIKRGKDFDPLDDLDRERYQTVYGVHPGAVAAPTAGLHFTPDVLGRITDKGVKVGKVTLHVGPGTFAPVREQDYTRHSMHSEWFSLSRECAELINGVKAAKGRVVAVGTTSARVLETVAREDGTLTMASGWTDLYIYPPYRFKAVDILLTNFHLPRSTLLLLVSAFAGRQKVLTAYNEAVDKGYRFYSYGDAMLMGDDL